MKQAWVKKLREVIQETYFSSALPLSLPKSPAKLKAGSQRSSRWAIFTKIINSFYLEKIIYTRPTLFTNFIEYLDLKLLFENEWYAWMLNGQSCMTFTLGAIFRHEFSWKMNMFDSLWDSSWFVNSLHIKIKCQKKNKVLLNNGLTVPLLFFRFLQIILNWKMKLYFNC